MKQVYTLCVNGKRRWHKEPMEYLTLNNGVQMPVIGFGTWDVRGEQGKRSILEALEAGYRLIDTAQMYNNEDIVGEAMKESGLARDEVFITTKLYRPCASYRGAKDGIERSLNTLQTDYIDLFLIHEPYDNAHEMYEALTEAHQAEKIRAIGISNFDVKRYKRFVSSCDVLPAVNQVESHVYFPQLELKTLLDSYGTQMQSWASFTEWRRDIFSEPHLNQIGAKYGKSSAQVALRFLVQNGIAVIPKSIHRKRMEQNLAIFDFQLSQEDMKQIKSFDGGKSLFGWY